MHQIDLDRQQLPPAEEPYDVILCSHVIEHLRDPRALLRQLPGRLRPDGILLVATPVKPPGVAGLLELYRLGTEHGERHTQRAFTVASLRRLCLVSLGWSDDTLIDGRGLRVISA